MNAALRFGSLARGRRADAEAEVAEVHVQVGELLEVTLPKAKLAMCELRAEQHQTSQVAAGKQKVASWLPRDAVPSPR